MLFSLGGMFQRLWSLPISRSLTRPNHRTNNQVHSILTPHRHTHTHNTQTHTNNTYTTLHTYTHATHIYHTSHTHTEAQYRDTDTTHVFDTHRYMHSTCIHPSHTHTHTHTHRLVPPWGQGPCLSCFDIPVHAPGRAWHLVGIPLLPRVFLPWTSRLVSAPILCALCYSPYSCLSIRFRAGVMPVPCSLPPIPSHFYLK